MCVYSTCKLREREKRRELICKLLHCVSTMHYSKASTTFDIGTLIIMAKNSGSNFSVSISTEIWHDSRPEKLNRSQSNVASGSYSLLRTNSWKRWRFLLTHILGLQYESFIWIYYINFWMSNNRCVFSSGFDSLWRADSPMKPTKSQSGLLFVADLGMTSKRGVPMYPPVTVRIVSSSIVCE